jgi:hypothetical protein
VITNQNPYWLSPSNDSIFIGVKPYFLDESGNDQFFHYLLSEPNQPDYNQYFIHRSTPFMADWVFFLLLGVLFLFAYLRRYRGRRVSEVLASYWNSRFAYQLIREEGAFVGNVNIVLLLNAFLLLGFFGFKLWIYIYGEHPGELTALGVYAVITASMIVFFLFKLLVHRLFAGIFQVGDYVKDYLWHYFQFFQMLGVALLPIAIISSYTPSFTSFTWLKLVAPIIFIAFVIRLSKTFYRSVAEYKISPLYIILYLCAFEILPWIIASKWLLEIIKPSS